MKQIALVWLLLASTPAAADFIDGNRLFDWCRDTRTMCSAYVMGVADGVFDCVPDGVTGGQLADVVKSYLERNPAQRHNNGADLTKDAIKEAWCPGPSLKPD
jgi:hypothetical protein